MRFRLLIVFVVGYVFFDWVSYIHPLQQSNITPWNPQPALAVALLALRGQRWAPAVFCAVLLADVLVRQMPMASPATYIVSAVLTLSYAAMASAISGLVSPPYILETRRGLGRLVGVIAIGALVTGTLYTAALWAIGANLPGRYFEVLLRFWIGDCVGILVTLPPILIWADPVRRAELKSLASKPETYLMAASMVLAFGLAFGFDPTESSKLFYLLFLPLIWVAVGAGLAGATFAVLLIQFGLIIVASQGEYSTLTMFQLQAFLICLAVTGLFLGGAVDERRRAANDLTQSLRLAAAGEMSAALAHELNQPLTALATYARAASLLMHSPDADRAKVISTLDKVLTESNRAADVVRRLRDFFRTGAIDLQSTSIVALAKTACESMNERARDLNVELTQHLDESAPDVLIDVMQIEVVIRNLLANGIEAAASETGPRHVAMVLDREATGYVRVVVEDSGPGVVPALRDQVFEPFWSTRAKGMGMGLAISRAIVEAHGGRIWVETQGHGVFGFTIPVPHA